MGPTPMVWNEMFHKDILKLTYSSACRVAWFLTDYGFLSTVQHLLINSREYGENNVVMIALLMGVSQPSAPPPFRCSVGII